MEDFIAGRKRFRLREANLLRAREEKRHSFVFEQTLTEGDDTMNGMPEFIQVVYVNMLKSSNLQKRMVFEEWVENVAIDFYPTPKGKRFFSTVTGATLSKFVMERQGKGVEPVILLTFTAIFNGRKEIHEWTFDHKKADFWALFEPQQGEIFNEAKPDGEGEDVEEDDEAEPEPEPETPTETPAKPKRGLTLTKPN